MKNFFKCRYLADEKAKQYTIVTAQSVAPKDGEHLKIFSKLPGIGSSRIPARLHSGSQLEHSSEPERGGASPKISGALEKVGLLPPLWIQSAPQLECSGLGASIFSYILVPKSKILLVSLEICSGVS